MSPGRNTASGEISGAPQLDIFRPVAACTVRADDGCRAATAWRKAGSSVDSRLTLSQLSGLFHSMSVGADYRRALSPAPNAERWPSRWDAQPVWDVPFIVLANVPRAAAANWACQAHGQLSNARFVVAPGFMRRVGPRRAVIY